MNIAVFKVLSASNAPFGIAERQNEGMYSNSSINAQIERIRGLYGKEQKLTIGNNDDDVCLTYENCKFYILEVQ